ncbi:hypothetical protein OHA98_25280 [Streptomyces sp. NBC_00654]|uniref:hypothetical protein n=1 Tax=Streptomyces sp. NBC_00654 TaxID=2975799 RepID=UPI00224DB5C0|nr:hypothetical protein [Streptomyces sp. NBC_00654]MCX4968013.1 hypothetical protein [Streptomyces sp. NBC_00654]
MGAGPAPRLVRTVMFAVVCVAVSGLGHALMSGGTLPPLGLASAFLLVCGGGWWLAGRVRSGPVTVAASAVGQLSLHTFFTSVQPRLPGAMGAGGRGSPGSASGAMTHSAHDTMSGAPMDAMASAAVLDGSPAGAGMLMAHVIAGLLCGWWLWGGEAALVQLGRSLALFVCAPLWSAWRIWSAREADPAPVARWRPRRRPGRRLQDLLALHGLTRRGPPPRVRIL